jgi:hypothetical protein
LIRLGLRAQGEGSQAWFGTAQSRGPGHSPLGVGWTAATASVMFILAAGKRQVGQHLRNPVLLTEGRVTFVDGLLATAVLVGLVLNTAVGSWWAVPLAGYVILVYGVKEGRTALRSDPQSTRRGASTRRSGGRIPACRPNPRPSVRSSDRTEPRPEPLRHRVLAWLLCLRAARTAGAVVPSTPPMVRRIPKPPRASSGFAGSRFLRHSGRDV